MSQVLWRKDWINFLLHCSFTPWDLWVTLSHPHRHRRHQDLRTFFYVFLLLLVCVNAEMRETVVISASKKSLGSMPPQSARSYWKSLETSRSRDLIEISIHQTPSNNRSAKIINSYKSRDIFLTLWPVKAQTAFFFQSWARQSLRNRANSWWACLSRKSPGSCRHLGNQCKCPAVSVHATSKESSDLINLCKLSILLDWD